MKKLYFIILSGLGYVNHSLAQPTMTAANFNPVVGQTTILHNHTPTTLAPGNSGANQTWNFASTPNLGTLNVAFMTPASTPYAASFPTANLANNQNGLYEYMITNNNFMARAGVYASGTTIPFSDEEKYMTFPMSYNGTYTDPFGGTFVSGGFTFTRSGTIEATADGYGTLILPWGTVTNVLRIYYIEDYQDVYAFGTIDYYSETYAWVKPGTHYFLYSMTRLNAAGNITYGGFYIDPLSVGIENIDAEEIMLSMYPNPASEILNVNFVNSDQAPVSYTVTNTLGQNVYTSDNGIQSPGPVEGKINVSEFPDGIYFLNITIGDKSNTSKFVVRKS